MSKRTKIILGIIGVVLVAGTAATIIFWPAVSGFVAGIFQKDEATTEPDPETNIPLTVVDPKIVQEAESAQLAGNPEQAAAVYDKAIAQTDDDPTKAALYVKKSQVYADSNNNGGAIEAAEAAYAINNEDFGAITMLAALYENAGNYTKAAEFYQKAADLNPADDPTGSKDYYQQKATELKAK